MAGFTKSSGWNYWRFLFGDGSDGDVVISSNTDLASTLNGAIVYKNYRNLTVNAGCTLSVSNACRGLWIRVRGTLILNGTISMSLKAPKLSDAGSDLYIHYADIKVPAIGAAGGAGVNTVSSAGNRGGDGVDGQCGGGGSGGFHCYNWGTDVYSGAGAAGFSAGGGSAGSGAGATTSYTMRTNGNPGQPYGGDGGAGTTATGGIDFYTGNGAGGANGAAGGILIIVANRIEGSGTLRSNGANGGNAWFNGDTGKGSAGGGGGAGGGSITLMYLSSSANLSSNLSGGAGGAGANSGGAGGAGGSGSIRQYSTTQLASHPRL